MQNKIICFISLYYKKQNKYKNYKKQTIRNTDNLVKKLNNFKKNISI